MNRSKKEFITQGLFLTAFVLIVLVALTNIAQAQMYNTYVHDGANIYVFDDDSMSVWGNANHDGQWYTQEGGVVKFYGETFTNDTAATMPGAGQFYFQQPRPAPYANDASQQLEGGHVWESSTGCSFPDVFLENANDLYLINNDSKVRDTFNFVDGHVIHDKNNFTLGENDPGEILNYNETQFFVTNGDPEDVTGYLEREGMQTSDGVEAFPIGNAVGDYTPGALDQKGVSDDMSMRVSLNTFLDGTTGTQFNEATVTRTWDVEERLTGGSDVDMQLQHNNNTEGYKFNNNRTKHYITHYTGVTPNSNVQGNGVDTVSNYKWDLLKYNRRDAGTSTGTITTGSAIANATITARTGLSAFSPYTKTIYAVNSINPIVDYNTTMVNTAVTGGISSNDQDPEGHNLTIAEIGGSAVPSSGTVTVSTVNGSLTINKEGEYVYTPDNNYTGEDSIVYTTCDDGAPIVCEEEVLYLTVLPIPYPSDPSLNTTIANPDEGVSYGNPVDLALLANDDDMEGNTLEFKGIEDPNNPGTYISNGTINNIPGVNENGEEVANSGSITVNTDGTMTYTPAAGFVGKPNPLDYYNCDDVSGTNKACDTTKIYLTVFGNNPDTDEPPFAGDDYKTTNINTPVTGDWASNDTDPNVNALTDRITINGTTIYINPDSPLGSGSVAVTLNTKEGGTVAMRDDGSFLYTPPADYSGPDQVRYEICDTVSPVQCDSATIYLLIDPINTDFGDLSSATAAGAKFIDADDNGKPEGDNAIWAGSTVTDETTANTNATATADGGDDGLIFLSVLDSTTTNTFKVPINSNSDGITAYAQLEIDWDNDGVFDSTYTASVSTTVAGIDTAYINDVRIPVGIINQTVNYRLRVSNTLSDFAKNLQDNGEVEDYQVNNVTAVPVDLVDLSARWNQTDGVVSWATATETNNKGFIVERKIDQGSFEEIGMVYSKAEHGNSSQLLNYQWVDQDIQPSVNKTIYYRLRQVDFDETETVYGPVALTVGQTVKAVTMYPNPAQEYTVIRFSEPIQSAHEIQVYDGFGKLIETKAVDAFSERTIIPLTQYRAGIYYITITNGASKTTQQLLITD